MYVSFLADCLLDTRFNPPRSLSRVQVIEYYGELNQQYKNYLFFDLLQIEKGMAASASS